ILDGYKGLDCRLEFSQVAGPGILDQKLHDLPAENRLGSIDLLRMPGHKFIDNRRYFEFSAPQWGNAKRDGGRKEVKLFVHALRPRLIHRLAAGTEQKPACRGIRLNLQIRLNDQFLKRKA